MADATPRAGTPAPIWATVISTALELIWRLRFNVHFDWDGFRTTILFEPVLRLPATVEGVRSRDDSQPRDERLFTAGDWISIGQQKECNRR